jgi:glycosyltransferase involved in cell wall biosynthesis
VTVGVVIGTYGDMDKWSEIAERAIQSIRDQSCPADRWIHVHSDTLANARNQGAKAVDTDWLIFLDADDELDPRYIESMLNRRVFSARSYEIIRPSTLGVYPDGTTDEQPVMLPWTDLTTRNCVVIGAMCPSSLFFEVGGFGDWPILEDWALWRAMVAKGARIADCKEAIYRVHVNEGSRNTDHKKHGNVYRQIQKAVPL